MSSFFNALARKFAIDRRQAMFLAASTAAVGVMPGGARDAFGQNRIVVGTWGGEFNTALEQAVGMPMRTLRGAEYVSDVGAAGARKARLMAERERAIGSTDIVCLDSFDMHLMAAQNVLRQVDAAAVPNVKHVLPGFARPYSVPLAFSGKVIVYNPDKVATPRSLADLWSPKYAGKIGFADLLAMYVIESAAQISGGSPTNYEPGKAKLLELKQQGLRLYPSNEALAAGLKSGEIWATIMWRARAQQWKKAGLHVANVAPDEGATPITFELAMVRNAPNAAIAPEFLNRALHPDAQAVIAERLGYAPTVATAKDQADKFADLGFTPAEMSNFFKQDFEYLAKNQAQLLDWWARSIRT